MSAARHSAVYRGRVRHHRRSPRVHVFEQALSMLYLDLDELPRLFDGRWLWSHERRNVVSYRRRDFLGDPDVPLREAVLARVAEHAGAAPDGPVRVLTNLRTLGVGFNPVSFYYCFDRRERLQAVVAEITNTPWNERHAYVVSRDAPGDGPLHARFPKHFHVSPFMDMHQDYVWSFGEPGEQLGVSMRNERDGELLFDVGLSLRRRAFRGAELARCLLRFPCITGQVLAGIYWQALRLWLKRVPFHVHPNRRATTARTVSGGPP